MITTLKHKLIVSILHKKKTINLTPKEKFSLLQTQTFCWTTKKKTKLSINKLSSKLTFIKLYAKKK